MKTGITFTKETETIDWINNFDSEDIIKRLTEFSELYNLKMSNENGIPKNVYFTYHDRAQITKLFQNQEGCNGNNI